MKKLVAILLATGGLCIQLCSQITCTNEVGADITHYTNGAENDSVYFICQDQVANLVAYPPSGTAGWNFEWYYFAAASNSWVYGSTDAAVPSSTRNVAQGGYRVKIYDGDNSLVGSYIAWVSKINFAPVVNANTIPDGCGSIQLSGLFINGSASPYYNPPALNADAPLIINEATDITICFTANHTYVSDLAFYLVGPESCGSPTVLLSPNPGFLGQDTICNFGNGVSNLCFSNTSVSNLNVCDEAPFTLSGTYGTYGPDETPIAWSSIYGCNANILGWSVQVYDCVSGDIGALTDATLSFNGEDPNGNPLSVVYSTPAGFNSPINDNSCSADSASVFNVISQVTPAVTIPVEFGFEWVADPPFLIPNYNTSLTTLLNPGPTVSTNFTLRVVGPPIGDACYGISSDTEHFNYITPQNAVITAEQTQFCAGDTLTQLNSNIVDGQWIGAGITDSQLGIFDPDLAGPGSWNISFVPNSSCITGSSVLLNVAENPVLNISGVGAICGNDAPFSLSANYLGGIWSGEGIQDSNSSIFYPSLVTDGMASVNYLLDGICPVSTSIQIPVQDFEPLVLSTTQNPICINSGNAVITANIPGGVWSGPGISNINSGTFSPQITGAGLWTVSYGYDGVCNDNSQITIEVVDDELNILPVDPICIDNGILDLEASPAGGVWSGPGITNQLTGVFNPMSIGSTGDFTVIYQLNNACNPSDSIVVEVVDFADISFEIPDGLCLDANALNLIANPAGGTWSGTGIVNTQTGEFNPQDAGVGLVDISYVYDNVCSSTSKAQIEVYPLPVVIASGDTTICAGGQANLNVMGALNYLWYPISGLNAADINNPVSTPSGDIIYTVSGESDEGCIGTDEVTVSIYTSTIVELNGPFVICENEEVQLSASGLTQYNWIGEGLTDDTIPNPIASPSVSQTYQVSGTDINGCLSSGSITVDVMVPIADFIPSQISGVSPLVVTFDNLSNGNDFIWDFGNGSTLETWSVQDTVISVFSGEETYTVTLTSILNGCPSTYSMDITSYYDSEILVLPNVVTPNGDGKNDVFEIKTQNMEQMEVIIYNRWGVEVGRINNPESYWTPIEHKDGVYYFVYTAAGLDNEKYDGAGNFTVLGVE